MSSTILIVEDHEAVRSSLRDWLKGVFPQCDVVEAASGEEAIAIARVRLPRVVVMDIGLPRMNGIEATRQIKATVPAVQVVVLTIHEEEAYRADAVTAGAAAYVPKRVMQTELVPTLATLLSNKKKPGNGLS
jgi:DNA-binding NarL/FixJ family response regulator